MADTRFCNQRGILSDLGAKWKSKMCIALNPGRGLFCDFLCKNEQAHFGVGITRGKMMDTNLKFSLITTDYCLGVIVAFSLTAILH
ncbi:YnhF family membrane protein [Klebsiella pneumoniae subsp. pneumoniae]|nr:YnhF family membrane protein [Klebsiella pneumoniae subsp. pneumoniae]